MWADGQHGEQDRFGRKTLSVVSDMWNLRLLNCQALSDILSLKWPPFSNF